VIETSRKRHRRNVHSSAYLPISSMASTLGTTSLPQSLEYRKPVGNGDDNTNRERSQAVASKTDQPAKSVPTKYRHVAAVHVRPRTSLLSSDNEESTSFVGFRNLMVIVLSKYRSCGCRGVFSTHFLLVIQRPVLTQRTVVMNLRLVIENFMKVESCLGRFGSSLTVT